jgi:urea transport system substrate-binding protein
MRTLLRSFERRQAGAVIGALLLLTVPACSNGGNGGTTGTQSPITVGSILDETGGLNIYGTAMSQATKLAVKDINGRGGVLGRQLSLKTYDAQSDNAKYTQYASTLTLQDKAAVIMGGITSASREALRPVVDRAKTLYFYNEQYEGGVCDKNVFSTGVVPSQQLAALVPYAADHFGKKLYVIAADYNYGHISADWVTKIAQQSGAQVVKTDFIPLDVSEFGSVINNIQAAKPDVVVSLLVGGSHIAFYRQFYSAGLNSSIKVVSATFGLGNEQVVLSPSEDKGLVVAYPYFQELNNAANQNFTSLWHKEYGNDYPYITDSAVAVWNGWHLWALAANKAGSLDRDKVIAALESGLTFDSPSGKVTLDPKSHHVTQAISIASTSEQKGFSVIDTKADVPPSYEMSVCDLIKSPDTNKQFTP